MNTDMELQRDVLDEIAWEPSVAVSEIGVTVYDGIVTFTGNIDNLPAGRRFPPPCGSLA